MAWPPKDKDGNPVTLNWDQVDLIWSAISVYEQTRAQWDPTFSGGYSMIDLRKSCLLGRLLVDGKPPLPEPPPCLHAAPWYGLIEDGHCGLPDAFVSKPLKFGGKDSILIGGYAWILDKDLGDGDYWIRYHKERGGLWLLSRDVPTDCGPCGQTVVGAPEGETLPLKCDWYLERIARD